MGKAKKGKRSGKDDEMESDVDVDEQSVAESVKSKSKTKDKKKKKGDDIDDLVDELTELKVEKSKGKKGKKSKRGDDDSDDDDNSVSLLKSQKGKGRKVNNDDNDDDNNSGLDSETEVKSKSKGKKNQVKKGFAALELNSDAESDNEVLPKAKAKPKKKKGKKTDDFDDDNDVDQNDIDNLATKIDVKNKTNSKKNKKKNDDESEDDIPKPKGKTKKGKKVSVSDDDDDDEFNILPNKPSNAKAKTIKSGFALLDVEGDDDDDDDDDNDDEEPSKSEDESEKLRYEERPKGKPQQQTQKNQEPQGKKGKKGKKKQDSDDEIEKALAELEMEYSGKKNDIKSEQPSEAIIENEEITSKKKKENVNESKIGSTKETNNAEGNELDGEDGSTVKSAAQKKKEKKEREKQKKMAQKKTETSKKVDSVEGTKESSVEKQPISVEKSEEPIDGEEDEEDGKKKKKKGPKEDPKDKGKGPGRKMLAAMQEALKKAKEDEERAKQEEEERIRQEELREKARLEQLQLEQERKEKKKLKEKQRKERLKAEGKLLTTKQKQDRARAQAMLEALKAQGMEIPDVGEKKQRQRPSLGTRLRPNKIKQQTSQEDKEDQVQVEIVDQQSQSQEKVEESERKTSIVEVAIVPEVTEEVKDSWDADSTEDEHENEKSNEIIKEKGTINRNKMELTKKGKDKVEVKKKVQVVESSGSDSDSGSGDGSESESDEGSDDEDDENSVEDKLTDAEKKRERARLRIQNRRIEAEKKKTLDDLRAAVVCVLGHVDTGKTKILDKLRRTNVQDGEAGGITQQIGATNVPIDAIRESTKHVKGFADKVFKIPGLLIIDTPGHESFSNLRNRGSSLCDIAVLVVDIMHGLEPQTLESIGLLKAKKCPFVVALNKIDRLYDWQTMNRKDVQDIIKAQAPNTQREFEKRSKDVILEFAEQGLNAALFYENPDPRSYVSLVPTSAITGEGMGNLLALIVDACQGPLAKRLMFSEELQATVLEVKALPGLGTTIDCILVNGTLREGETMIVAGTDGPIVTQIRSLLMPQPLKELRVKNAYIEYREIKAAQGVKIAAKDLDKAIAGLNLQIAQKPDEVDLLREEIAKELSKALGNIKLAERGVFVQASTLGALEALLDFLRSSKIPFIDLGVVTSIEYNHKTVESARKGQEVCVKIEPIPSEAPKMFGRHFDEKDFITSKISRQSIDACKDYFRDDLLKTDWQLMVELKKLFQIL
ncbi:hypothetical protein PV328_009476 [Microctonus aethiopoides]|uniref:Tr-type G domain-containing protein n=1 Tax=Microctonus aethiopoides TaxID=144406 RepID=A0AA39C6G0_9HYME|nr:hypothetical protein PV328_009476 [Microctonus aethiopoides]